MQLTQLEKSCNLTYMFFAYNRVLGFQLEMICSAFLLFACLFSILGKGKFSNEFLAFVFQSITDVMVYFSISIRMLGEIENYMTSAQRIHKYTQLEGEDELVKPGDYKYVERDSHGVVQGYSWPNRGEV